jgi:hypothetical protein
MSVLVKIGIRYTRTSLSLDTISYSKIDFTSLTTSVRNVQTCQLHGPQLCTVVSRTHKRNEVARLQVSQRDERERRWP